MRKKTFHKHLTGRQVKILRRIGLLDRELALLTSEQAEVMIQNFFSKPRKNQRSIKEVFHSVDNTKIRPGRVVY